MEQPKEIYKDLSKDSPIVDLSEYIGQKIRVLIEPVEGAFSAQTSNLERFLGSCALSREKTLLPSDYKFDRLELYER